MLNYLKRLILGRRCLENYNFVGEISSKDERKCVSVLITYRGDLVGKFYWFTKTKTIRYRDVANLRSKGFAVIPEEVMSIALEIIATYFYHHKIYDPIIDVAFPTEDCNLIHLLLAATKPSGNLIPALSKCSTYSHNANQFILHRNVDVSLGIHSRVLDKLPLVYYLPDEEKDYYVVSDKEVSSLTLGVKSILYPNPALAVRAYMNEKLVIDSKSSDKLNIYSVRATVGHEVIEEFNKPDSHLLAPVKSVQPLTLTHSHVCTINKELPMLRIRAYGNSLIYNHSPLCSIKTIHHKENFGD